MGSDLDLVQWERLTPEELGAACQQAIDACEARVGDIVRLAPGERTYANTMLALEDATEPVSLASGAYAFLAYVAADDALRTAAREWDERLDRYMVSLAFREDLYEAVRQFAEREEAKSLTGEDARYLAFELRDYRRNGFGLPREQRERVRQLMDELAVIGVQFRNNIDDYDDGIEVTREQLAGMPEAWIERLRTVERDGMTYYRVLAGLPGDSAVYGELSR